MLDIYTVDSPDSSSYINRYWGACYSCNKKFMAGAEGKAIWTNKHDPFIKKLHWVCSDTCATFYILKNMGENDPEIFR